MSRHLRSHTGGRLTLTSLENDMAAGGDVVSRIQIGVIALAGAKRALAVVVLIALYPSRAIKRLAGRTTGIDRDTTQPHLDGFATDACYELAMEPAVKPCLHRCAFFTRLRPPALQVLDHNGLAMMIKQIGRAHV